MAAQQWCLLILPMLSLCSLGDSSLGCGSNRQIVSRDMELLPIAGISASNSRSSFPVVDVINFAFEGLDVWCSDTLADSDPYILLSFTSPVVITGLVSGGYNYDLTERYVTNFTIEYSSPLDPDNFTFYSTSGSPKHIPVPTINTLITLEEPFLAKKVRLSPTAWYDPGLFSGSFEYICWSLLIFGCTSSNAIEASPQTPILQTPTPSAIPHRPSPRPSPLPPTTGTGGCTCTNTCPPTPTSSPPACPGDLGLPEAQVVRDYQSLAIALPIALVTILIVAAIVGMGVALFVWEKGREKQPRKRATTDTLKILDNSGLYSPSVESSQSRKKSETIKAFENVLYSTEDRRPLFSGHSYTDARNDFTEWSVTFETAIPASTENNQNAYEMVGLAPSKDTESSSMVYNPRYGETEQQGSHDTEEYAYSRVDT